MSSTRLSARLPMMIFGVRQVVAKVAQAAAQHDGNVRPAQLVFHHVGGPLDAAHFLLAARLDFVEVAPGPEALRQAEEIADGGGGVGKGFPSADGMLTHHMLFPDQQRRVFPGMIGALVGGVAAVIGGEDEQVVIAHQRLDFGQAGVEVFQRLAVALHVAAVAIDGIGVH